MKKLLLVLTVLALSVLVIAGCNRNKTKEGERVLGVSLPNITNPYYVAMKKSFEDHGKANGFTVRVLIADNDDAKQLSQLQSLIQQKVTAIALNPVSSGPGVSQILECNKAGIPVFTINIMPEPEGMEDRGAVMVQGVQTDQYMGGYYIGQQLIEDIGTEAEAIIGIVGEPTSVSANTRDDGFKDAIAVNPNAKVVALVNGKVEETTALRVTTEMLQGNPDMNIVYSDTEPAALGAAAAIKELGLGDKVKLYAFVDKNGVRAIMDGTMVAGAIQEPARLAQIQVENIRKYLDGDTDLEYIVNSPPLLVNSENAEEVLPMAY